MNAIILLQILQIVSDQVLFHLKNTKNQDINSAANIVMKQLKHIITFVDISLKENPTMLYTAARDLSFALAHIYIGKAVYISRGSLYVSSCNSEGCRQLVSMDCAKVSLCTHTIGSLLVSHSLSKESTDCDKSAALR